MRIDAALACERRDYERARELIEESLGLYSLYPSQNLEAAQAWNERGLIFQKLPAATPDERHEAFMTALHSLGQAAKIMSKAYREQHRFGAAVKANLANLLQKKRPEMADRLRRSAERIHISTDLEI